MQKFVLLPFDRYSALTTHSSTLDTPASRVSQQREVHTLPSTDFSISSTKTSQVDPIRTTATSPHCKIPNIARQERALVLCSFSNKRRRQAEQLLDCIIQSDALDYNDQGQLLVFEDSSANSSDTPSTVQNSNISDLIRDALRSRTTSEPVGADIFYDQICTHAPAHSLIQNKIRMRRALRRRKRKLHLKSKSGTVRDKSDTKNSTHTSVLSNWQMWGRK